MDECADLHLGGGGKRSRERERSSRRPRSPAAPPLQAAGREDCYQVPCHGDGSGGCERDDEDPRPAQTVGERIDDGGQEREQRRFNGLEGANGGKEAWGRGGR